MARSMNHTKLSEQMQPYIILLVQRSLSKSQPAQGNHTQATDTLKDDMEQVRRN